MFIIVFFISCMATYLLSKVASTLGFLAHPDEYRQHEQVTPLLGGLAVLVGLSSGLLLISSSYLNIMPSLLLLCFVGLIDDRYKLPAWSRFVAQAIAAYLMIELTGVDLKSLGYLISEQSIGLQFWSMPLTIFAVIGVINAVNMSDGMDGLAASLVTLILLAILFSGHNDVDLLIVSVASISGFLVWNLRLFKPRARIFMGDAGSTMLGMLLAYFLISGSQPQQAIFPPVTALWLLALPLFDTVAVLIIRPLRGKSPFLADRIHYHHLLRDAGLSVNQTLVLILIAQLVFVCTGAALNYFFIAENIQFFAFMFVFFVYVVSVMRMSK